MTVLDLDTRKLEALDSEYRGRVVTLMSNPANIDAEVATADLLIGAVLIPAAKAPIVVTKKTVAKMRHGRPSRSGRRHELLVLGDLTDPAAPGVARQPAAVSGAARWPSAC